MTCIPAGNKSINAKVGLLTCLVVAPSRSCGSVAKSASNIHPARVAVTDATYSNWYCSRFSLDSLFINRDAYHYDSFCCANIINFSISDTVACFFCVTPIVLMSEIDSFMVVYKKKAVPFCYLQNGTACLYLCLCYFWL